MNNESSKIIEALRQIFTEIMNNPFFLYTFFEKYCYWLWGGTNICHFYGSNISTLGGIVKLFVMAPFIASTIYFPFWLYFKLIYWCGSVYANTAKIPGGMRLKSILRGNFDGDDD